jgi:hypothetical protein
MNTSSSADAQLSGALNCFAIFAGAELGRGIAQSAQWTLEHVRTAEGTGIIIGNMCVAAVADTLFPESATFVKVMSVGCSLFLGGLCGFASAAEKAHSDGIPLSVTSKDNAAKWSVAGMVAGGALATVGAVTLYPAAGPLLGGATAFLLAKYGTLREAKQDQLYQRA